MIENAMDPILVIILVLSLALIAFVFYRIYRKVRLARLGPPKSLTIQRSKVADNKSTAETKGTQVIGMVSCEYCGSLMPQTAISCPNCGASRKK
jgi:hypothetical protein